MRGRATPTSRLQTSSARMHPLGHAKRALHHLNARIASSGADARLLESGPTRGCYTCCQVLPVSRQVDFPYYRVVCTRHTANGRRGRETDGAHLPQPGTLRCTSAHVESLSTGVAASRCAFRGGDFLRSDAFATMVLSSPTNWTSLRVSVIGGDLATAR